MVTHWLHIFHTVRYILLVFVVTRLGGNFWVLFSHLFSQLGCPPDTHHQPAPRFQYLRPIVLFKHFQVGKQLRNCVLWCGCSNAVEKRFQVIYTTLSTPPNIASFVLPRVALFPDVDESTIVHGIQSVKIRTDRWQTINLLKSDLVAWRRKQRAGDISGLQFDKTIIVSPW